ncbi:Macrophage asialoglycoprotein-binding protein [Heterocephalus glaber]|uniref:Macrophage asialoglycoprotein-binding protein n=1 Tax=Heterocephalus glaber TaxID=10181 RepID=G5B598_HETGA|nr:Macrophage asialoglycoprotein-binding protein [Heterocephalus glaber]
MVICVIGHQGHSLKDKVNSLEETLQKKEQEFKADQSQMLMQVQKLIKDLLSLSCQLVELKSNGSKTCCPLNWMEHEGSCYWFSQSGKSWLEANKSCQMENAHLVIVNSLEEQRFIEGNARQRNIWIGLTDKSGSWKWVGGSDQDRGFTNWSPEQPDDWYGHGLGGGEDCAHFTSDGRWNDDACVRPYHWVCEIESQKDLVTLRANFNNFTSDHGANIQELTSKGSRLQEATNYLKAEMADHRQELHAGCGLNQKMVFLQKMLEKKEQEFKAEQMAILLQPGMACWEHEVPELVPVQVT